LIRLGAPSLWADEGYTATAVRHSPAWWIDNDQYHVLYNSVASTWTSLAGTSEWALRVPSVFGAMAACALLVVLARKFFDRRIALISGVFLATSPFIVKWSQQARGYTLILALGLLATLLLLRALDRGSRASWAIYGVAFSAVVVWHAVAGLLLVPAHAVLVAQRRERALPHGPLAAVIICALAVPWAAVIAMRSTGAGVGMNWLTAPTPTVVAHAVLDVSGVAGLGLLLAIIGLWVLHRARKANLAVWLGAWAFAPSVLALLPSTVRPVFLDRYLILAAPAFALLAAVAVTGVGRRLGAVAGLAAVVATSIGLIAWYSTGDGGNWRGEDWRSAVGTVLERRGEADAIVVAPWSAQPAATYYGARVTDVSNADSVWVLTWSETGDELKPDDRRALGFGDHRLVERLPFGWRVTAQLWRREP
jgi:mannosyltransferase